MTTSPSRGGSSVFAHSVTPSLQLAKLVELLVKAHPPSDENAQAALPLVVVKDAKVLVNTRGVLVRLFRLPEFVKNFEPGADTGFIRDMLVPPRGTTARVGGRLLHGTEGPTSKGIEKLQAQVSAALDTALKGVDLSTLTVPSLDRALQLMAESVDERKPNVPATASLVPVVFASNDRTTDDRKKDIGKVLTAIETIEGPDRLELLCQGIANKLRKAGVDDDDIDEIVREIQSRRNRPGDQIRDFLDFLDDEALARVRLQVTMSLMEALAAQSTKAGFNAYVSRVKACFEKFASVKGRAVLLDPSLAYGQQNVSDLAEHLRKAMFYTCLPAWAEGSAQLFETRTEPTKGFATLREVSYRFRVNGNNPQTGQPAFVFRTDRMQERLFGPDEGEAFVRRDIAELVFLYLVIPSSLDTPTPLDVEAEAARIEERLKKDPRTTLRELHAALAGRHATMQGIAGELVDLLRSKVNKVVSHANTVANRFTVSVHRGVVNWESVDSLTPKTDILVKAERGSDDSVAWFDHLTISQDVMVPGSLASYTVKTELKERSLTLAGDAQTVAMKRDLSLPVLPVRLVPYRWLKAEQQWVPDLALETTFETGAGIDIQYDLDALKLSRDKDEGQKARSEQLRSAAIAAFSLTVYVVLWDLQRRVRAVMPEASITMLRLQHSGRKLSRDDDAKDPNTAVYAISQALEKALAREGGIKLQGLTTRADRPGESLRWKRTGALNALLGSQPMKFGLEGSLDKVALVTYVTRPCDSHPAHADADGYLFLSRTYTAERSGSGAVLRTQRMRSRLVESRKDFKNPQPILEEIARLRADGFMHVMLLSHHFGNRHIGRAAERHAPHGTLEFLDEAMKRFPEMNLYALRRDVFPATRLRRREATESGFEVLSFKDHQEMYASMSQDVLRSVMPIYTFATLAVVGDDKNRPQSGFCTYFYDAEQRITNIEAAKTAEMNILGIGQTAEVRKSLVSVLRAIHFVESEKPSSKSVLLPVLDPFDWANPTKTAASGEIEIMSRRGGRSVLLCVPAVLAHVTKVLHKDAQ